MDPVEETLIATQNLLCALEQDSSLLSNQQFMDKLAFLRSRHKETTDLLHNHTQGFLSSEGATYHRSPGCTHYWSDLVPRHHFPHVTCQSTSAPVESDYHHLHRDERHLQSNLHRNVPTVQDAALLLRNLHPHRQCFKPKQRIEVLQDAIKAKEEERRESERNAARQMFKSRQKSERPTLSSHGSPKVEKTAPRLAVCPPKPLIQRFEEVHVMEEDDIVSRDRTVSTPESKNKETRKVSAQRSPLKAKASSVQDLRSVGRETKVTVPKPFNFTNRKYKGNTYAQKFLQKMLDEKELEEKEKEEQDKIITPFKAHPVPITTYKSDNPRVHDQRYADAIRKKLQTNYRLQTTLIRSQSMGDVTTTHVRPVPSSTYVAPSLPSYRRERSASRRAVQLLSEAHTPPGLREHSVKTNLAFHLRHQHCRESSEEEKVRRPSMPDFNRLHREFHQKLERGMSAKPPTIPVPFKLSENSKHRHRQCKSTSPPRVQSRRHSPSMDPMYPVHSTHSASLRAEAVRKKLDQTHREREKLALEREERRAEVESQRQRLQRSMSQNRKKELEKNVEERRRAMVETTKEYERDLMDMKKRVMARPLIMEQQSVNAQKHQLERKYNEAMAGISVKVSSQEKTEYSGAPQLLSSIPSYLQVRRSSGGTGDTFSVKSKASSSGKEDYKLDFESDEDKASSAQSYSSKSSKSSSKSRSHSKSSSETSNRSNSTGSTSQSSSSSS